MKEVKKNELINSIIKNNLDIERGGQNDPNSSLLNL